MTSRHRRHLGPNEVDNKMIRSMHIKDDPRTLRELAKNQAWLTKIQARRARFDPAIHREND